MSGEDKEDRTKWLFSCDKCYGQFQTRRALTDHVNRKLFKCNFVGCKQKYTHKYELVAHQKICAGRLKSSSFDCYKIYHMIDVRHKVKPRQLKDLDLWVKYPYWHDRETQHYLDYIDVC